MAYRNGIKYDEMAKLAIDVYIDYGITSFPIDAYDLANKMGIEVILYSDVEKELRKILRAFSEDGFSYSYFSNYSLRTIFIDNITLSNPRKEISILHEIKHILLYEYETGNIEADQENEDLANYFAKYMKCPIPYLIYNNIWKSKDIKERFNVSEEMAKNVSYGIINRMDSYGNNIFDYELPLLQNIYGENLDSSKFEIISKGGEYKCN